MTGWLLEDGTKINVGDAILEVETDKIAGSVEAHEAGVLRRRVGQADTIYPVKTLLGVIADPAVPDSEIDAFVAAYVAPVAGRGRGRPGPEIRVRGDAGRHAALRQARRRRRDRDPHPRLRRRPRQLAVQHRCAGREGDRLCARPARPWAVHQEARQARASAP